MAGVLDLAKGLTKGLGSWQQSRQVRNNARVLEQDMENNKQAMLAARIANSKREAKMSSAKLADIESMFAVSGIEMGGDPANYIAQVAAVDELNSQQLTQDAYYAAAVIDVQKSNMRAAAKFQEKALKINAITSVFGATFDAGAAYTKQATYESNVKSSNQSYWDTYGPTSGSSGSASGGFLE